MKTAHPKHGFRESTIRGMARRARDHGAIDLAQGAPSFPVPDLLTRAIADVSLDDLSSHSTWGTSALRTALARKYETWHGLTLDPEREITITGSATDAMIATMLARSAIYACATIVSPSPTRSTSTWCMTRATASAFTAAAASTCRWRRSRACASAPCRSAARRRRSA